MQRLFRCYRTLVLFCVLAHPRPLIVCGQEAAPTEQPATCVHIDSTFVRTLYGKSRKEVRALFGVPQEDLKEGLIYVVKAPGLWREVEGGLFIHFVGGKALGFLLNTKAPADNTFVRMVLQSSPGARFEPSYQASNLTGLNWADKSNGFFAVTEQATEHEFLFMIELTPPSERTILQPGQNSRASQ